MQQDNMNKSGLAADKTLKAAWSKPKIEDISVGSTDGKITTGGEFGSTGPS